MSLKDDILLNLRSRVPLTNIITVDESRVLRMVSDCTKERQWPAGCGIYTWDIADQFGVVFEAAEKFDVKKPATPDTILNMIEEYKGSAVFILKDFHFVWEGKKTSIRKMRNMAHGLVRQEKIKAIFILTPSYKLPEELKEDVNVLYDVKPDIDDINALLDRVAGGSGMLRSMRPALREKIVSVSLGLSELQAEKVFRKAIVSSRSQTLDESCLSLILQQKQQIIRESGALEFCTLHQNVDDVGGLEVLKKWLNVRERSFTDDAKAYGLEPPRGLAFIGIPGTGKSLCAKVAASMWKMPLLRLDMGAVFSSALGSSEKNIRDAIQISEVVAPCILWIDEIEKAFSHSQGDSGTATRVLGTFLTWMQEKKAPVVVLATANNVEWLPPEFLRKGRFDEIFFLDLPTTEERKKIFEVHLRKKGYTMIDRKFDLTTLSRETRGFVGAELEAVVKDAMFPAFIDGEREMTTADILNSVADMVPLAKSHHAAIEVLRKWLTEGLARNASGAEDEVVQYEEIRDSRKGRKIDM